MPRTRSLLVVAALLLSANALEGPAGAAADPQAYLQPDQALNILPPGSRGNVGPKEFAALQATGTPPVTRGTPTTPPNFADQLEMYDALAKTGPGEVTAANLTDFYKQETLGLSDAAVVSSETLTAPDGGTVTIKRDTAGVPHIKGTTYAATVFGTGYANIEDRMFVTDVLRHTGAARMTEFLGPSPANLAMDRSQLAIAAYTPEEAEAQVEALPARYGAEGDKLVAGLDAMIAGMNAAQAKLCPLATPGGVPGDFGLGFGPDCPVEYAALQKPPTPYTRADIIYIASLVGGIFGKGGGGELANARWLQQLEAKFGVVAGRKVFDDLREKNDPEAPTTSQTTTPYGGGGVDPTKPGVALPDLSPSATAPGTGSDAGGSTLPIPGSPVARPDTVDGPLGPIHLDLSGGHMSNALLVDAAHSAGHHPTVVFGPQTGYYTPQLLVEQDVEGPGIRARGVSFAGTNLVVELGRGLDYAWSATSASNDIVDTVAERLCTTDGSPVTVQSTSYIGADGSCVPMQQYTHSETALPNAGSESPPDQVNPPERVNLLVLKTRHGIVQLRTTVKGVPVAIVTQRTTYNHEVDSAVGFARLQDPGYVHDATSFQHAVAAIDYTFNWFYADDRDIAYFCSGLLPRRAAGVDWDLPRWGDARYDGNFSAPGLPFAAHPRAINPAQGYLVSWNNKPAPGFSAADNHVGYGSIYRSLALEDRIKADFADGTPVTRESLVSDMEGGATVDVRAAYLLPELLAVLRSGGGTPTAAETLLADWLASGAHRVDRARTGHYDHQAAVALFDAWWDSAASGDGGSVSLPKTVMGGVLDDLVDQVPFELDDHPRLHIGSAFNDVGWYGWVDKDLRHILGRPVRGSFSRSYCGSGLLSACRNALAASLAAAADAVMAKQGASDVTALTYDKSKDFIVMTPAGVVGVRPIDWQNRPTFQQVIHFTGHRPRAVEVIVPDESGGVGRVDARAGLPTTGAPALVAVTALGLLTAAAILRRRTRTR